MPGVKLFACILEVALLCRVSYAATNPHAKLGSYKPVSDVVELSQLAYDVKNITNLVDKKDFQTAKAVYLSGRYSCRSDKDARAISDLAVKDAGDDRFKGKAFADSFVNGTGPTAVSGLGPIPGTGRLNLERDFWHQFILTALEGTGDFVGKTETFRMVAVKKGILGLIMMFVSQRLETAIFLAKSGNFNDENGAPHIWDSAWAIYYGACGDQCPAECVTSGWCRYSAWEATMKRDVDHTKDKQYKLIPGTVVAKDAVTAYFQEGLKAARTEALDAAEKMVLARNKIYRIWSLTAIRATLRYSYHMNRGNGLKYPLLNELLHMQAFAYFLSAAGWIEQASPGSAKTVLQLLDVKQDVRSINLTLYCDVMAALTPAYEKLQLDCTKVGKDKDIPDNVTCPSMTACPSIQPDLPSGAPTYSPDEIDNDKPAGSNIDCPYPLGGGANSNTGDVWTTVGNACRGASVADNDVSYYVLKAGIASLGACKTLCLEMTSCIGIEFSGERCELWTRKDGIGASVDVTGYTCLRLSRFGSIGSTPAPTSSATSTTPTVDPTKSTSPMQTSSATTTQKPQGMTTAFRIAASADMSSGAVPGMAPAEYHILIILPLIIGLTADLHLHR